MKVNEDSFNESDREFAESSLSGKRAAVVLFSEYSNDPRPRRAAEALVAKGMKVEVICIKGKPDDSAFFTLNGVEVRRLPIFHQRGGKLTYFLSYFRFFFAVLSILTLRSFTRRYAIVHVHNMPDFLVFTAIMPKLFGAKVILDLHDPMPELMQTIYGMSVKSFGVQILQVIEKVSTRYANVVITVNKTCKKIFSKRGCSKEKIEVIMNSPDENIFSVLPPVLKKKSSDCPYIVMYHGSLVERNGLALAIDAIKRVHENFSNVELRIFGRRTPFLDSVLEMSKENGSENFVRYMGPKKIEEIVEAIDECDLGVIPNLRNIFTEINTPTRIFEFLSRGKPVVVPSSPGVREYFSDEELMLFELGDAKDLADRIEDSIKHPDKLFEITCRGQAVCVKHQWLREKEKLIEIMQRLLTSNKKNRLTTV